MSFFDELFSSTLMINEQLSRELFNIVPEDGMIMVIMDPDGSLWISDPARFEQYFGNSEHLKKLVARVNDGCDFVLGHYGDCSLVVSDMTVGEQTFGYTILIMPDKTPEETLDNIDAIELLLNQTCLVASLIHKNNDYHFDKLQKNAHSHVTLS